MPLDLDFMIRIFPELFRALILTVQISFLALLFGIVLGILLGSLRVIGPRYIQIPIQWLVNYIRGTPQLVQFLIVYFALPRIGIVLNEYWTGVVALTVIAAGYEVEIVRAAIESIDKGQKEAALAVGMSEVKALRLVLLPQAMRRMIPALTNELSNVIKASALLSVIAVNELTKVGNKIIYETFYFFEVLIEVAVLYLIVIGVLGWISSYFENKVFAYGEAITATEVR
ncbi:MAG: amino acid ABC transporter permease [Anaerolineae bacterium]|nr:amino acid ABC transporter permease [Anaerolineae bacterium]